ncbi:unnamed protein product, partial [Cercopithifilaria johnstoni]
MGNTAEKVAILECSEELICFRIRDDVIIMSWSTSVVLAHEIGIFRGLDNPSSPLANSVTVEEFESQRCWKTTV